MRYAFKKECESVYVCVYFFLPIANESVRNEVINKQSSATSGQVHMIFSGA